MRSRPEDWPERLDAYVREAQTQPFVWGTHDCCTFAADWVLAITGVDPMGPWRGEYRTASGAQRLTQERGGLDALVTEALGAPIATAFAQRGDVVMGEGVLGPTMGIVLGVSAAFPGVDGIEQRLIAADWKVWRL